MTLLVRVQGYIIADDAEKMSAFFSAMRETSMTGSGLGVSNRNYPPTIGDMDVIGKACPGVLWVGSCMYMY